MVLGVDDAVGCRAVGQMDMFVFVSLLDIPERSIGMEKCYR